jgi:hypothetical protein
VTADLRIPHLPARHHTQVLHSHCFHLEGTHPQSSDTGPEDCCIRKGWFDFYQAVS